MVNHKDKNRKQIFVNNVLFGVTYDLRSCRGSGGYPPASQHGGPGSILVSPRGICGGQTGTGIEFSRVLLPSPVNFIPPVLHYQENNNNNNNNVA
jgi:hypothetical protein